MRVTGLFLFWDGDRYVAAVFDNVAELFKTCFQTCHADCGWAHIYATAGLAEVERDTNHADFARYYLRCKLWSRCHLIGFTAERAEIARSEERRVGKECRSR